MKKLVAVALVLILILCGCSDTKQNEFVPSGEKLNIITTIFPQYDFVRQIAGDRVNLHLLIPPGSESHTFEPTPKDIINIQNCDVFIYTGGENDEWVREIISTVDTDTKFISLIGDVITPLENKHIEGVEDKHFHAQEHSNEYDEHIWTSPVNAGIISKYICDTLCSFDSKNEMLYKSNYNKYQQKLDNLDTQVKDMLKCAKRNTIIFGDRFPVRYFTEQYKIDCFSALPGCSAEVEPSSKTLMLLTDKIRNENIPIVFYMEFSNKKVAKTLSEETGAKMLLFHSCHNITSAEFKSGITYIDIMTNNLNNLREALN